MTAANTPPPPFTGFSDLYPKLTPQYDQIKSAFPGGQTPAFSAYSKTHSAASDTITKMVNALSPTQIGYMSGIGFRNPGNTDVTDDKNNNQSDIINAVLAGFDSAASKYVKGQNSDGDSAAATFKTTLGKYDTAVQTQGKTPAPAPT